MFSFKIVAKEIDSKQDLQQEESAHLPAEHRSFPEPHHGGYGPLPPPGPPGPPNQGDAPPGSEHWPLGRPDVSQIKACLFH